MGLAVQEQSVGLTMQELSLYIRSEFKRSMYVELNEFINVYVQNNCLQYSQEYSGCSSVAYSVAKSVDVAEGSDTGPGPSPTRGVFSVRDF